MIAMATIITNKNHSLLIKLAIILTRAFIYGGYPVYLVKNQASRYNYLIISVLRLNKTVKQSP
jgi:hypothetical protein